MALTRFVETGYRPVQMRTLARNLGIKTDRRSGEYYEINFPGTRTQSAKIDAEAVLGRVGKGRQGKMILVTASHSDPQGHGKTLTTLELTQALASLGKSVVAEIGRAHV